MQVRHLVPIPFLALLLASCKDSTGPGITPDCAALNLAVGEQQIIRQPNQLCFGLLQTSANEAYLVGIQSVSEVLSSLTPVSFTVSAPGQPAPQPSALPEQSRLPAASAVNPLLALLGRASERRSERLRVHRRSEAELRSLERRRLSARPFRHQPRDVAAFSRAAAQRNVNAGDTLTLRVPDRTRDFCSDYVEVRAVARVVGQHGIWLDDIANPAGGFTTADYEALSQQFDNVIHPRNVDYFGQPTDIDGNDRILILTTREINRYNAATPERAILGFVTVADFFPRQEPASSQGCAFSNEGEIYYGLSPDPDNTLGWPAEGAYTRQNALQDAPNLIAHEFTHIIQFGRRVTNPAATTLMEIWEAEGQALIAEEVVGHAFTNRAPRNNYGFDVAFNDPPTAPIDWYLGHFVDLALYYGIDIDDIQTKVAGAPEQCSWVDIGDEEGDNGPCFGRHVYGVPWSLLRWASDHFGPGLGGEQVLHRQLVDNATRSGFANLANVTGTPIHTLLAQWAAMLYVDDRIAGAAAPLTMQSWNLNEIFNQRLIASARLQPRQRGFTPFADTLTVRAGSSGYFRLSGGNRQVIDVRASGRTTPGLPAQMQLWVVRLQ